MSDYRADLVPEDESWQMEGLVASIEIGRLAPDPHHPRRSGNPEAIARLARSLQQHGLLEPVVVRPVPVKAGKLPGQAGKLWVVSGLRRVLAAKQLGWARIHCRYRSLDPAGAMLTMLAPALLHQNLTEMEIQGALQRLQFTLALTEDELALRLGVEVDDIRGLLTGGKLPPNIPSEPSARTLEIDDSSPDRFHPEPSLRSARSEIRTPAERRTEVLERGLAALQELLEGVHQETWSERELSAAQRDLLDRLYRRISEAHQQLCEVRLPLLPHPRSSPQSRPGTPPGQG